MKSAEEVNFLVTNKVCKKNSVYGVEFLPCSPTRVLLCSLVLSAATEG